MEEKIKAILETPFWPESLESTATYFRPHDDNDGNLKQGLAVTFGHDGDAWVTSTLHGSLRFRMPMQGGGRSPRVRNALLVLAIAIKMDNEDDGVT